MLKKLDGSLFTADNYSAFGNSVGLILQNRMEKIVGYTDDPAFHHFKGDYGLMFLNTFGKEVWTDVTPSFIKSLLNSV